MIAACEAAFRLGGRPRVGEAIGCITFIITKRYGKAIDVTTSLFYYTDSKAKYASAEDLLSTIQGHAPIETHHQLSTEDREREVELIAAIGRGREYFARSPYEAYDTLTAMTPIVAGFELEAVDHGDVCGWWVRPPAAPTDRAILFVHGGAYRLGSARAYRGFASQIAARVGAAAFVLEYPLAPIRPFPAAFEAVMEALPWLRSEGFEHVSLVGDSAGGGLVFAASNARMPASSSITSVVAFSPWTDLACTGESFSDPNVIDPIFDPFVLLEAASVYLAGADSRDGRASPLYAISDNLPPIAIQVGGDERLLDDSRRYATVAAARGGVVHLDVFEGLHHVFQRSTTELLAARKALDDAAAFIGGHWSRT